MINWGIRERLLKRTDNPATGMEDNLPKKRRKERVLSMDILVVVDAVRLSEGHRRCGRCVRRATAERGGTRSTWP